MYRLTKHWGFMMLESQSTVRTFRTRSQQARHELLNHYSNSGRAVDRAVTSLSKARDAICCPNCSKNHRVFVEENQTQKPGWRRWMFDFYICLNCDRSFKQAGLPIVLPGALMIGLAVLMVSQLIRAQF